MSAPSMALPNDTAARSWPEGNQRWLSQRFAYWREYLARSRTSGPAQPAPPFPGDAGDIQPAALHLRTLFGLTTFETELIVLAAGLEIDSALRAAVAEAQGVSPREPVRLSLALALALLPEPHWDAISPSGPLRHWSLVDLDTTNGFGQALLRIDERVLHYLTGVPAFDERLIGVARFDDDNFAAPEEAVSRIARAATAAPTPLVLLTNASSDAAARRLGRVIARACFDRMGLRALSADIAPLVADARALVETARCLDREAALTPAGIVLALDGDAHAANVVQVVNAVRSPVAVLGSLGPMHLANMPGRQVLRFTVPTTAPVTARPLSPVVRRAADRCLQQFRVEPDALDQALDAVADLDDESVEPSLWNALRDSARGGLDSLAERIHSRTTYDDLVLPPFVATQLRDIASQLRHRLQVYTEWGFGERHRRGLGIAALFAGESGTGKTLAAEAIANEAQIDLYRIDLASVVSKYIGETEKNLSAVFDAAERSGAVLLFDEADALFGKRSEVRDSHDRYANIEVAYLLQRVESYRGLAILTTNMKSALDRAFMRRIRFIVQFPLPDEQARAEIWRRQFSPNVPLQGVDFRALSKLTVPGGDIRSIAVNAAFLAADRGCAITPQLLAYAVQTELAKRDRNSAGITAEVLT